MKRKAAIAAAVVTVACLLGGCAAEENQTDDMEQTTENAVQQEEPEKPEVWKFPAEEAWSALLEHVFEELDVEMHPWTRFVFLPEGGLGLNRRMDPSLTASSQQGEWLLLAEVPEKKITFYYNYYVKDKIFLRYEKHFQVFEQDVSQLDMLPELTETEWEGNYALSVFYRHHTGNGGITGETVVYSWDGRSWIDQHFSSDEILEDPERPNIEGLQLTAELPEKGIAVYTDPQTRKSWLCSGGQLQEVTDSVTGEAELHYGDFNGDGTEELAVLSGRARDGRLTLLTVYQWNGQFWKGRRDSSHHFEVIDGVCDPNDCFQFYEDGTAYLMYEDKTMLLDLSSICQDWETEPAQAILDGSMVHYTCQDRELLRTITGYIEGHNDVPVFSCVGTFGDYMWYWPYELRSPYEINTEFDIEQLSDAQKEVLRQFISGCREVLAGRKNLKKMLFEIRLALCDLDGDGNQELLLEAGSKDFADYYGLSVYRTDGQYLRRVPSGSRFYDNGLVWEPWSHNQGVNCAIWPFDLYRLQDHEYLGGARARHSQAPGEFPAEADLDGDGMVYLVGDFNDGDYVDNAVYDEWWASCVGDARLLPVCYFPLTEEIIDSLKEDTIG